MTLTELRELADEAPRGPWRYEDFGMVRLEGRDEILFMDIGEGGEEMGRFVARCSPEVVKALIAVAEAAESAEQHYVVDPDSPYVHLEADCCGDALAVLWAALDALKEALRG